jgi:hypothetical protein
VTASHAVDLLWLPLGAGGHVVPASGRLYEALAAWREHRAPHALYHSALEVRLDGDRYAIEQAPVWSLRVPERGVVCEGPVGSPSLGRYRWFRYEVRRWRGGVIPDRRHAVASDRLSTDRDRARRVIELVPEVPAVTWGRDELRTGEMWNSNSLVAWLLARSGHEIEAIGPPCGGRSPGWRAGVVLAARQERGAPA